MQLIKTKDGQVFNMDFLVSAMYYPDDKLDLTFAADIGPEAGERNLHLEGEEAVSLNRWIEGKIQHRSENTPFFGVTFIGPDDDD